MKLGLIVLTCLACTLFSCSDKNESQQWVSSGFDRAEQQLSAQLKAVSEPIVYPRTIRKDGKLRATPINDWTEGFYPGCLWYMYEYTQKQEWKDVAVKWTEPLEPLKKLTNHHDIGFLMYCSFGNAYRLTGNEIYKDILVESARSLCTRFNEKIGCIESWNYRKAWNGKDEWFYPVIIDNMMNLDLLFYVNHLTNDSKYKEVALRHAETTMKNHFRNDHSSYHVVSYNSDGSVEMKCTHQGKNDDSSWARGQAWGVYGQCGRTYAE